MPGSRYEGNGMEETFGRYQVVGLLGKGGMAEVHLARQLGPQGFVKPCVLKRIAPEQANNQQIQRLFLEEARISALLNHPHIVQVFDFGQVEGRSFLALELVDGVHLGRVLKALAENDRWLPLAPSIQIIRGLLEALDYAHTLKDFDGRPLAIVHRDVSPQNTLISRQGSVKLADFGIAIHAARESLTVLGQPAKGKPGYMAPEQAMGGAVDGRSDLFAAGVMIAELISGRRLLPAEDRVTNLLSIERRVRSLCALRPEVPPELVEFVVSMTHLEPDHRPKSARDAIQLLAAASHAIPAQPTLEDFARDFYAIYAAREPGSGPTPSASLPPPPAKDISEHPFEAKTWTVLDPRQETGPGWPSQYLGIAKEPEPKVDPKPFLSTKDANLEFVAALGQQAAPEPEPKLTLPTGRGRPEKVAPAPVISLPKRERVPYHVGARKAAPDGPPPEPIALDLEVPPPPPQKKEIPPVVWLGGLGAVGVVAAILVVAWIQTRAKAPTIQVARQGVVKVTSVPAGADIWVDGQAIGQQTPAELSGYPLETALKVSVRRPDYLSIPKEVILRIPSGTAKTSAHFTLKEGRVVRIETTPPEATLTVNELRMKGVTPLVLEPIVLGETASVSVQLEGYLPGFIAISAGTETASVVRLTLEKGVAVDVSSDPPGAEVYVDKVLRGRTPIYGLVVPESRRFVVRMSKRGFKPWYKTFVAKKLSADGVVAELVPRAFLDLPMNKEDRTQANLLDKKVRDIQVALRIEQRKLAQAEKKLVDLENRGAPHIGDLADAQNAVDKTRERIEGLENLLQEAQNELATFQDSILLKLEGDDE